MYRGKGRLLFIAAVAAVVALSGCMGPAEDDGDDDVGDDTTPSPTPTDGTDGGAGTEADPASGTFTVTMVDNAFQPQDLWVEQGTTVTWENHGQQIHTATADDGSWDTGDVAAGESGDLSFDEAGTFAYVCTYHEALGMTGTLHVV